MTTASALIALNTDVVNARTVITNKGGTVTVNGGSSQLATDIATIPTGSTPVINSLNVTPTTSAQTITAPTGTDGYSPVNVSAVTASIDSNITAGNIKKDVVILGVTGSYEGSGGGGIGIPREISNQGKYQMPTTSFTFSLPNNATDVGDYGLNSAFYGCLALTEADLSSLTTISGNYGLNNFFRECTNLTTVDLSSLTTVSGSFGLSDTFYGCTNLITVDLSSLNTVSGYNGLANAFCGCTGLSNVNLPSLTTISGNNGFANIFRNCENLITVRFSSLTTISGGYGLSTAFNGCMRLTDIYFNALTTTSFGSYTNQFYNMMGYTNLITTHTIHFPSNLQSTIQGLDGYPLFGGTSGYVVLAFDLPATS